MTLQQYIESITRVFQDKNQTEIAIDLNAVLRDFCERSKILRDALNMTPTTITLDSTKGDVTPITLSYNAIVDGSGYISFDFLSYADDGVEIAVLLNLHTYDSNGIELSDMCSWAVVNNEVRIYSNIDHTAGFPTTVDSMKMDILKYATPLVELGDVPEIPVEFHRALEAKVMAGYYRRMPILAVPQAYGPMLSMAKSLENEYEEGIVKAKRVFNVGKNLGSIVSTLTL